MLKRWLYFGKQKGLLEVIAFVGLHAWRLSRSKSSNAVFAYV
jgi:hypothetical protein